MSRVWREPRPVAVREEAGVPAALEVDGRWDEVVAIETRWRVDEEWRGGPARDYFLVVTERGVWGIVYRDLVREAWFLQGVYD